MKRVALAGALLLTLMFLLQAATPVHAQSTSSLSVSPAAGVVGSKMTISGQGYPPDTNLLIKWDTVNASYVVAGNPPQVNALTNTAWERTLASVETDGSGSFSVGVTVPQDYGNYFTIKAFAANGTALPGKTYYSLNTAFSISPTSGPAGTPIVVTSTGLGTGLYTFCYFLYWDNTMVGYYTGISTKGTATFTFYASGTPGTYYVQAYGAYPGPGYLNPQQSPYPTPVFTDEFNITSTTTSSGTGLSGSAVIGSLAVVAAVLAVGGLYVSVGGMNPEKRKTLAKGLAVAMIVIAIAVAGIAGYLAFAPASSSTSSTSPSYTPVATVVRPTITVPQNNATSGPRISVTPDIATVGQTVTVNGSGFSPNQQEALSWSTRKGNNLNGFKLVAEPLKNVTVGSTGSFDFTMKVPADLGGFHYISAGDLTQNSNGTLYIERSASINATQGPAGSIVAVTLYGVGWTFNTNIAALDYDNSYIGFGCGFNSGGNVTFYLTVTGAPGVHTIDVYPSVWWGNNTVYHKIPIEYDFPLLTPQDHPAQMPSFHFSFLITSQGGTAQTSGAILPGLALPGLAFVTLESGSPQFSVDSDVRTAGEGPKN